MAVSLPEGQRSKLDAGSRGKPPLRQMPSLQRTPINRKDCICSRKRRQRGPNGLSNDAHNELTDTRSLVIEPHHGAADNSLAKPGTRWAIDRRICLAGDSPDDLARYEHLACRITPEVGNQHDASPRKPPKCGQGLIVCEALE